MAIFYTDYQEKRWYVTFHSCKAVEKGIGDYIETRLAITNAPSKGALHKNAGVKGIKGAPVSQKLYRTMPGGPVERTIEYVAPFDRCDREQDYETAWKFFEEKYGKVE